MRQDLTVSQTEELHVVTVLCQQGGYFLMVIVIDLASFQIWKSNHNKPNISSTSSRRTCWPTLASLDAIISHLPIAVDTGARIRIATPGYTLSVTCGDSSPKGRSLGERIATSGFALLAMTDSLLYIITQQAPSVHGASVCRKSPIGTFSSFYWFCLSHALPGGKTSKVWKPKGFLRSDVHAAGAGFIIKGLRPLDNPRSVFSSTQKAPSVHGAFWIA